MTGTTWRYTLLYDGGCPLCLREVRFLQRRDRFNRIQFVDIDAPDYDPEQHAGISYEQAMGRIHAIRSDGVILQDVEVFRQLYAAIGLGWIYAPTRWPLLRSLIDWVYGLWADRRLAMTGRPDLATLAAERQCRDRCQAAASRPTPEQDLKKTAVGDFSL